MKRTPLWYASKALLWSVGTAVWSLLIALAVAAGQAALRGNQDALPFAFMFCIFALMPLVVAAISYIEKHK